MIGATLAELRYGLRHPWARTGAWLSAGLTVAVAGLAIHWWPSDVSRTRLDSAITAARGRIAHLHSDLDLLTAYGRARTDAEALEGKLDYAATQAQQVGDVAQLARKQGITILSQAYEADVHAKGAPTLNTELVVQGSYRSVRNFIVMVPSLPSLTEVSDVVLERAREPNLVKGRIRLVTHRRAVAGPSSS
jgi:hypothetical protein